MYFTYKFLSFILYPIFLIIFFLRILLTKENWESFKEKFLFNHKENQSDHRKLIWFHAASIGEATSIFPIIKNLIKRNSELKILVTTVTLSSSKIIKKEFSNEKKVIHQFLPLDIPFLVDKFLNNWKPSFVLFIDSEIWPNFIFKLKERNIFLGLINGRITKKTFNRWLLVKKLADKIFSSFDLCLASSKESLEYLKNLNVKNAKYFGNLKFAPQSNSYSGSDEKILNLKNRKVWCAANTHFDEEAFCFKTHIKIKKVFSNVLTIIIPRHINRTKSILKNSEKYGLKTEIFNNQKEINPETEIALINTFGQLQKFFKICKSVFIGKSMIKSLELVGGQNPLEAVRAGCKIYHGPFVYNFQEVYDLLNSKNISKEIVDESSLATEIVKDFDNSNKNISENLNKIELYGKDIFNKTMEEIDKIIKL